MSARSFLHPLMGESERVRLRLRALGFPAVEERIAAMDADHTVLVAMADELAVASVSLAPAEQVTALGAALELLGLSRSPAWVPCEPWMIEQARKAVPVTTPARTISDPDLRALHARVAADRAPTLANALAGAELGTLYEVDTADGPALENADDAHEVAGLWPEATRVTRLELVDELEVV